VVVRSSTNGSRKFFDRKLIASRGRTPLIRWRTITVDGLCAQRTFTTRMASMELPDVAIGFSGEGA